MVTNKILRLESGELYIHESVTLLEFIVFLKKKSLQYAGKKQKTKPKKTCCLNPIPARRILAILHEFDMPLPIPDLEDVL